MSETIAAPSSTTATTTTSAVEKTHPLITNVRFNFFNNNNEKPSSSVPITTTAADQMTSQSSLSSLSLLNALSPLPPPPPTGPSQQTQHQTIWNPLFQPDPDDDEEEDDGGGHRGLYENYNDLDYHQQQPSSMTGYYDEDRNVTYYGHYQNEHSEFILNDDDDEDALVSDPSGYHQQYYYVQDDDHEDGLVLMDDGTDQEILLDDDDDDGSGLVWNHSSTQPPAQPHQQEMDILSDARTYGLPTIIYQQQQQIQRHMMMMTGSTTTTTTTSGMLSAGTGTSIYGNPFVYSLHTIYEESENESSLQTISSLTSATSTAAAIVGSVPAGPSGPIISNSSSSNIVTGQNQNDTKNGNNDKRRRKKYYHDDVDVDNDDDDDEFIDDDYDEELVNEDVDENAMAESKLERYFTSGLLETTNSTTTTTTQSSLQNQSSETVRSSMIEKDFDKNSLICHFIEEAMASVDEHFNKEQLSEQSRHFHRIGHLFKMDFKRMFICLLAKIKQQHSKCSSNQQCNMIIDRLRRYHSQKHIQRCLIETMIRFVSLTNLQHLIFDHLFWNKVVQQCGTDQQKNYWSTGSVRLANQTIIQQQPQTTKTDKKGSLRPSNKKSRPQPPPQQNKTNQQTSQHIIKVTVNGQLLVSPDNNQSPGTTSSIPSTTSITTPEYRTILHINDKNRIKNSSLDDDIHDHHYDDDDDLMMNDDLDLEDEDEKQQKSSTKPSSNHNLLSKFYRRVSNPLNRSFLAKISPDSNNLTGTNVNGNWKTTKSTNHQQNNKKLSSSSNDGEISKWTEEVDQQIDLMLDHQQVVNTMNNNDGQFDLSSMGNNSNFVNGSIAERVSANSRRLRRPTSIDHFFEMIFMKKRKNKKDKENDKKVFNKTKVPARSASMANILGEEKRQMNISKQNKTSIMDQSSSSTSSSKSLSEPNLNQKTTAKQRKQNQQKPPEKCSSGEIDSYGQEFEQNILKLKPMLLTMLSGSKKLKNKKNKRPSIIMTGSSGNIRMLTSTKSVDDEPGHLNLNDYFDYDIEDDDEQSTEQFMKQWINNMESNQDITKQQKQFDPKDQQRRSWNGSWDRNRSSSMILNSSNQQQFLYRNSSNRIMSSNHSSRTNANMTNSRLNDGYHKTQFSANNCDDQQVGLGKSRLQRSLSGTMMSNINSPLSLTSMANNRAINSTTKTAAVPNSQRPKSCIILNDSAAMSTGQVTSSSSSSSSSSTTTTTTSTSTSTSSHNYGKKGCNGQLNPVNQLSTNRLLSIVIRPNSSLLNKNNEKMTPNETTQDINSPGTSIGRICLSTYYENKLNSLTITIFRCHLNCSMAPVKKYQNDLYIKVYILSDHPQEKAYKKKTKSKKAVKVETSAGTIYEAEYNEILRFNGKWREFNGGHLAISLWHNDTFAKNSLLGQTIIKLDEEKVIGNTIQTRVWYDLMQQNKCPNGKWLSDNVQGSLFLAVKFEEDQDPHSGHKLNISSTQFDKLNYERTNESNSGNIHVLVKEVDDLINVRQSYPNISGNCYCKIMLKPKRSKDDQQKTKSVAVNSGLTLNNEHQPKWNEKFIFKNVHKQQLTTQYDFITSIDNGKKLPQLSLEIEIIWQDKHLGKKYLGTVRLMDSDDVRPEERSLWRQMTERPNLWSYGKISFTNKQPQKL